MAEYKALDELLDILEARGLQLSDRPIALHYLSTVGHYRLTAFYKAFYTSSKVFRSDQPTRLEDVINLYLFDRRLRLLIVGPLEKIEVALRALIIKEIGDYLKRDHRKTTISLFDKSLYDLSTPQNQRNYDLAKDACRRGVWTHWISNFSRSRFGRTANKQQREAAFNSFYDSIEAWTILHTASFGPLAHIFSVLKPEIAVPIAKQFQLPRQVLTTTFYALKELRNSCAHHEPIWDWDARSRAVQLLFPKAHVESAKIDDINRNSLYAYCALIHILLGYLSDKKSTWHRRLKKLVNEFNTTYSVAMGFPDDWQTMPFWCVSDVAFAPIFKLQRERFGGQTKVVP